MLVRSPAACCSSARGARPWTCTLQSAPHARGDCDAWRSSSISGYSIVRPAEPEAPRRAWPACMARRTGPAHTPAPRWRWPARAEPGVALPPPAAPPLASCSHGLVLPSSVCASNQGGCPHQQSGPDPPFDASLAHNCRGSGRQCHIVPPGLQNPARPSAERERFCRDSERA